MYKIGNKIYFEQQEIQKLKEKSEDEKTSIKEIANYFSVSEDTIRRITKENNIKITRKQPVYDKKILTQMQLEILNGCLLGDGCLYLHKNAKQACFSYTCKDKELTEYLYEVFKDFGGSGVCYSQYLDKRTGKNYTRYAFKTRVHPILTEIYYQWYKDNKKIIPQELKLTPITCLYWYIGDGCLSKRINKNTKEKKSEVICLATNCFTYDDNNKLINQLKEFNAYIGKNKNKKKDVQYIIIIPKKWTYNFLKYIGKCPFNFYNYKWETTEFKGKDFDSTPFHDFFKEEYIKGKSCYKIAKELNNPNITTDTVRYYLKKNNFYIPKNTF